MIRLVGVQASSLSLRSSSQLRYALEWPSLSSSSGWAGVLGVVVLLVLVLGLVVAASTLIARSERSCLRLAYTDPVVLPQTACIHSFSMLSFGFLPGLPPHLSLW